MRSISTIAVLVAAALMPSAATAQARPGHVARAAWLHSGPLEEFPVVRDVRQGTAVNLHGCLQDWSWCDITYRNERGWIPAAALYISRQGHRRAAGANMGIETTSFNFGTYWESHYRGRNFYKQRRCWQSLFEAEYRQEWRARSRWIPGIVPQDEGGEEQVYFAPYVFPDHTLENVKGKDQSAKSDGQTMQGSAQEANPANGDPARNPQP